MASQKTNNSIPGAFPRTPNKDGLLAIRNTEIYLYYYERLINLALSQFEWHGLPETVDRYYLEKCLLFNGRAAVYQPKGTDIWLGTNYVQRNTPFGMYDVYGYPRDIYGIPAGGYSKPSQIPVEPGKFRILFDNMTWSSLVPKIDLYARLMWEVHDTFRANMEHQLVPWIVEAPSSLKLTIENFFNRLLGHQRFLQLNHGLKSSDVQTLDTRVPFYGNEMLDCLRRLWAEALSMLGITSDVSKKERYVQDELTMVRQEDIIALNSRLMNRVEFCNRFNAQFGTDISVNLSSDDIVFRPYNGGEPDGQLYHRPDDYSGEQTGADPEPEKD